MRRLPLLVCLAAALRLPLGAPASAVLSTASARSDVRLRRASLEARRYLYELSGELPAARSVGELGGDPLAQVAATPRVLVANVGQLAAIHPALVDPLRPPPAAAPGSHFVQLVNLAASEGNTSNASGSSGVLIVCSGVDSTATLYAVYSLLEALGVRFRNHGDVIPRGGHGRGLAALLEGIRELVPAQRVWRSPNMALRGSQPFFDFPA
eukprot:COSAG06_NODE_10623_length_1646_cov_3.148028_1_plen_209_part_01